MLQVVCAVIIKENSILICQRSASMEMPLKWEFPGGKVEEGETFEDSLTREIKEELSINIKINQPLSLVHYKYPDFSIELIPFICTMTSGKPKTVEHQQIKWVRKDELTNYDWAEADLPIVQEILSLNL